MSSTSEELRSTISQEILELSKRIKEGLVYDLEATTIKETEGTNAFIANLPNGLTPEVVDNVDQYRTQFVRASTIAIHEVAMDVLKSNPDMEDVSGVIKVGGDGPTVTVEGDVKREKSYEIGGRKTTVYGGIVVRVQTPWGNRREDMTSIMTLLKQVGSETLKADENAVSE